MVDSCSSYPLSLCGDRRCHPPVGMPRDRRNGQYPLRGTVTTPGGGPCCMPSELKTSSRMASTWWRCSGCIIMICSFGGGRRGLRRVVQASPSTWQWARQGLYRGPGRAYTGGQGGAIQGAREGPYRGPGRGYTGGQGGAIQGAREGLYRGPGKGYIGTHLLVGQLHDLLYLRGQLQLRERGRM